MSQRNWMQYQPSPQAPVRAERAVGADVVDEELGRLPKLKSARIGSGRCSAIIEEPRAFQPSAVHGMTPSMNCTHCNRQAATISRRSATLTHGFLADHVFPAAAAHRPSLRDRWQRDVKGIHRVTGQQVVVPAEGLRQDLHRCLRLAFGDEPTTPFLVAAGDRCDRGVAGELDRLPVLLGDFGGAQNAQRSLCASQERVLCGIRHRNKTVMMA
jgi:hypothetical protein